MKRSRNAKIVATVGPASSSAEMLRALFIAGVDVFRLNFSHGAYEEHKERYDVLRELELEFGRPVCILQDLQGPKIRLGEVAGGPRDLTAGERVTLVCAENADEPGSLPVPHPEIFEAIMPGHALLIDDGRVHLEVKSFDKTAIKAEVIVGGTVSDRKGINLPSTVLDLSPLTEKDRADLEFGCELGVDYVALSFVQRPSDVIEAKGLLGGRALLLSKIEKPSAFERIDDIISMSDAIMVARGDLGVEIPPEDVPGRQKELISACRHAGKPVIVATQMLDSMVSAPTPTRAEASDVATAIYDGADAVMLSAESAVGSFPIETVEMMDRIIMRTEDHRSYRAIVDAVDLSIERTAQHAVSAAAATVAAGIYAKAIVAFTNSGTTTARIARERPSVSIISLTPSLESSRQLVLFWGVHSVHAIGVADYYGMVEAASRHAAKEGFGKAHDQIVVVSGEPFGVTGSTNNLRIVDLPEEG